MKISIDAVHYVQRITDEESKLKHTSRSESINSQTRIIYIVDERALETIRGVLTSDSIIEDDPISTQSVENFDSSTQQDEAPYTVQAIASSVI